MKSIVSLNVGGQIYCTTQETLRSKTDKKNFFDVLFEEKFTPLMDNEGRYFIDRDGVLFRPILHFLRSGDLIELDGVKRKDILKEMDYYGLEFEKEETNVDEVVTVHVMGPSTHHNFVKAVKVQVFGKIGDKCSKQVQEILDSYDERKKNVFEIGPSKADICYVFFATQFDHLVIHRLVLCLAKHSFDLVTCTSQIIRKIEHVLTESEYNRTEYIMHFKRKE